MTPTITLEISGSTPEDELMYVLPLFRPLINSEETKIPKGLFAPSKDTAIESNTVLTSAPGHIEPIYPRK